MEGSKLRRRYVRAMSIGTMVGALCGCEALALILQTERVLGS